MTTITKEWLQQTIAEFENTRDDIPFGLSDDDAKILIVLKRALASLEREQVRHEHADWSDATFGDVGPIGPLKHLSKEALETAAELGDLSEWLICNSCYGMHNAALVLLTSRLPWRWWKSWR